MGIKQVALAAALGASASVSTSALAQEIVTPMTKFFVAIPLDARNAKAPARFEVKAPKGAPNVIVFLIDDIGFGHASTFGGQIPMPTLERLESQGLK